MSHTLASALPVLEVIARGGGGGSGGGSGGSGGGSGIGALFFVGYIPTHFVGDWTTRNYSRGLGAVVGSLVGFAISLVAALLFLPFFPFYWGLVVAGAVVGAWTGTLNLIGKMRSKVEANKKIIAVAATADPVWDEASLHERITQTFTDYQNDWSHFNLEHIRSYTTDRYFTHVSLMLAALKVMGRQNVVGNPQLRQHYIANIVDHKDNSKDSFTAVIVGQANDQLIDTAQNRTLYTDSSQFTEYWNFKRVGNQWMLDSIDQATADLYQKHTPLSTFAEENGMFYSLDWGWLLLPKRGQLFSKSNFMRSDINNHVIGQWNGIIVQLYTYRPNKEANANYQIAQITLPKSYGGILIKRKGLLNIAPRGYQKITYEWPDFNKRYVVYATDADKVTSFELLNPKFMAELYDKNLKVEIEVVDNVVYLYSKIGLGEKQYPEMLEILRQAFHELKL